MRSAVGLGKVFGHRLAGHSASEAKLRGSLCLAQWQEGLPERRVTAVMEPGRRSNSFRSLDLGLSKVGLLSVAHLFCTYIYAQNHGTKKPARCLFHVAPPQLILQLDDC
jgi:hypothetical protein